MSRSTRTMTVLAILPALWAFAACAGVSPSTNDPFEAGLEGRNEILVHIINSNFYDARIYVLSGGFRRQLGTVTGNTERTFRTDWTFSQDLRLVLDLLAGPTCTTESLPVDPGDMLQMQIMPAFNETQGCR
ncbi:MAG: hypothetical protein OEO79_06010 [Gemmatimonadota bacterium]|nr:hypothetical protein [Gemmatimonadota bacterium]MDH3421802.1 hypothetical protein [Gemmatimonadota bacterium]